MLRHPISCACLLGLSFATGAQAEDSTGLDPIIVTGTHIERALSDTPAGVTAIDQQTLREGRQRLQLDESLARVPGLFLQNRYNFAQGQRLSLRGFGARAPFGVRGIRIRADGFPETLPDGQSQIDAIDLDSAVRAEVLRGPSSVLYGNAGGGAVSVETANGRDHPGAALRAQAGGDGFRKISTRFGGSTDTFDYHASLSHLDFEGRRAQSQVRRTLFNGKFGWSVSGDQRLEAVLTLLELPTAQDPGGLSLQELQQDRHQATPAARSLGAGQDVAQRRLGLTHRLALADGELRTRAFYSQRDFEQILPFYFPGVDNNVPAFERDFFGIGSAYRGSFGFAGRSARYTVGFDVQRQADDRTRRGIAPDGTRTEAIQRQDERADLLAGFGQLDLPLHEDVTLSLGARLDRLRLATDDHLLADGDDSGRRRFTEASYSGGLVWRFAGAHRLYANIATAFESPSFTEFARPDGSAGFNPAIQPQQSLNREIGVRNAYSERLHYELTLFSVRVDDEIIVFEQDGRDFFQNAGRTQRDGVETSLVWRPLDAVQLTASYSYTRLRFKRFVDRQGDDLSGRDIPGVPRDQAFLEAAWRAPTGHYAALDARLVGSRYAENANALKVGGYAVLNARGGYAIPLHAGMTLELFGGINNLFDRDYIANLRVNANAGDPLAERGFFEPAPGRHIYAGVALRR